MNFDKLKNLYFIGEIGINHNGDIQIVKKLIDACFACNWDCVKFQKRTPEICVPEKQKGVMKKTPWGEMTYLQYKHIMEFGEKEYNYINKYCVEKPLDWTASVWDITSLEFLLKFKNNVPFIKIPSAKITDLDLISELAISNVPILFSTGMSTWKEVDSVVNHFIKTGTSFAIMHTNSSYPTPRDELNLNLIPELKKRYGCVIGYSGHEPDLEPTVVAIALGAKIIERHITIDHNMWGTDQKSSLGIHAMDLLRKRCIEVPVMLGDKEKRVTLNEVPIRQKLRG
jgi:N-acetylneuraminate synthase